MPDNNCPNPLAREELSPTSRTTLKRRSIRGRFDLATINQVLDEALVCNVSFAVEGRPLAIPMAYARIDDRIVLHGSSANRMMRTLRDGSETCITVTLLDGLVLARSAFHHSVNYRSVVLYGTVQEIVCRDDKLAALHAIVEHIVPGRWADVRAPNADELVRTMLLSVPIDEASAKVRTGPPVDAAADYAMQAWAGEIPLRQVAMPPLRDPELPDSIEAPDYAENSRRPCP